jgi:hypothetical protein
MKLRISRTLMVAAVALVFGSAAYAQEINVQTRVPFDFVLGDKAYPAGQYSVQTANANTYFLSVKNNADKTAQGLTSSHPCISSKPTAPQIRRSWYSIGWVIRTSSSESGLGAAQSAANFRYLIARLRKP